jgi:hypothetical protein
VDYTHIVIVPLTHLESPTSFRIRRHVAVADDLVEVVASPPFALVTSRIAFHFVLYAKVIPRPKQLNRQDGRVCLSGESVSLYLLGQLNGLGAGGLINNK